MSGKAQEPPPDYWKEANTFCEAQGHGYAYSKMS